MVRLQSVVMVDRTESTVDRVESMVDRFESLVTQNSIVTATGMYLAKFGDNQMFWG